MTDSENPPAERRTNERRKLVLLVDGEVETGSDARRSGMDRRATERRLTDGPVGSERRSGSDRRGAQRRNGTERRRHTPAAFSREEAGLIRAAASEQSDVECPRCRGRLILRPPVSTSEGAIWQVRCETCHRCIMIKNL